MLESCSGRRSTRTLLVVDANFDVANALADAAPSTGWEPFLAGERRGGAGHPPRLLGEVLVLVDLVSPVSGGLALVLALRRNPPPPNVRVVVMTGGQPVPRR